MGYTMMCEQTGPKELVRDVQMAEDAGFDFAVISDHYFPWVDAMGHSAYAWSVLGAAAQATSRIQLMTYVTCPIKRYHPAIVAQKAATLAILSDNRFSLGVGAGADSSLRLGSGVGGLGPPVAGPEDARPPQDRGISRPPEHRHGVSSGCPFPGDG